MKDPSRILVIRRRAIGDVLVSLDVARALRERWPQARLGFVVDVPGVPVVEGHSFVDEVIIYDRAAMSSGSAAGRLRRAVGWLRSLRRWQPDLVVDLLGTPQTALWSALTGASVRVGPRRRGRTWAYTTHVDPESRPRFAGERFLDWARALGIEPGAWRPHVPPSTAAAAAGLPPREDSRPLVVLNPSATWSAKAWPAPHFAELARLLGPACDVRVAWGPGEEAVRDAIVSGARGHAEALPPTGLVELGAWLGRADLLVTTDSGPKHLAVATGTSTLTLFGSTDPRGWQPDLPGHAWITEPVDCHPCNLRECPVPGHPCLDGLGPRRVAELAEQLLRGGSRA